MRFSETMRSFALLGFCLTLVAADGMPAQPKSSAGIVKVVIPPFTVDSQPFAGAPERPDGKEFQQRLSDEATEQARRSLIERHIADDAQRVSSPADAVGQITIIGTVRMPISLPSTVIGWNASHRHGHFATATVVLLDATGKTISKQDVAVDWGDVWWFQAGKSAHNFRLDQVLEDFVRKAADRAVRRLDLRHAPR